MCFEDAIDEGSLGDAEKNVLKVLTGISEAIDNGIITLNDIPLIFLRVRNIDQFKSFSDKLSLKQVNVLTGFVFPKFNSSNGYEFMEHLLGLNNKFTDVLYGMPILESKDIVLKELRQAELINLQTLRKKFQHLILNVRVGATDLSSWFGVR